MTLDFFMLADGANLADGKLYVHGGALTRVSAPAFPSAPVFIAAVARFIIDPNDEPTHSVSIEVKRADADEWVTLGDGELTFEIPAHQQEGEEMGIVLIAQLLFGFQQPGLHDVRIKLDDETLATKRLVVLHVPPTTSASA